MVVVRGAFNELLRPGFMKAWNEVYGYKVLKELAEDDLYGFSERRTGVHDVYPGQLWFTDSPKRDLRDTPYAEDEWPPKDWPDYP